jgi:hypothetical protein
MSSQPLHPHISYTISSLTTQFITMKSISIDPQRKDPPTRDLPLPLSTPVRLPAAKVTKQHPTRPGNENGAVFFVGTATTIMFVPLQHFQNIC